MTQEAKPKAYPYTLKLTVSGHIEASSASEALELLREVRGGRVRAIAEGRAPAGAGDVLEALSGDVLKVLSSDNIEIEGIEVHETEVEAGSLLEGPDRLEDVEGPERATAEDVEYPEPAGVEDVEKEG
jgi:hypothetical protein